MAAIDDRKNPPKFQRKSSVTRPSATNKPSSYRNKSPSKRVKKKSTEAKTKPSESETGADVTTKHKKYYASNRERRRRESNDYYRAKKEGKEANRGVKPRSRSEEPTDSEAMCPSYREMREEESEQTRRVMPAERHEEDSEETNSTGAVLALQVEGMLCGMAELQPWMRSRATMEMREHLNDLAVWLNKWGGKRFWQDRYHQALDMAETEEGENDSMEEIADHYDEGIRLCQAIDDLLAQQDLPVIPQEMSCLYRLGVRASLTLMDGLGRVTLTR